MGSQVLCFNSVGSETYCIDVHVIEEVRVTPPITSVPGMPPWIIGVISVRGHLSTVVDFSILFGREPTIDPELLILIEYQGMHFAMTAHAVDAIYSIDQESIVTKSESGLSVDTAKKGNRIVSVISVDELVKRINR